MKKLIKALLVIVAIVITSLVTLFIVYDEPLPSGQEGPKADQLAREMINAVDGKAWESTGAVSWTFRNPHYHVWDRKRHLAKVIWKNNEVLIDINERKGLILSDANDMSALDKADLCETAWKFWVNDSFWLNPVTKAFDGGTSRSLVGLEDGATGLMVTYASGGATPGDSYLWLLDDNNRPRGWKMWVGMFPIGGLKFSWEDWILTETGAWIATKHEGPISIPITDVKTATSLKELTGGEDVFEPLVAGNQELISY